MTINIDPKVDCIFKALLGSEENQDRLIHCLNAIIGLQGEGRIQAVQIRNPFNEKTHLEDKLSVVDVKARDGAGCLYQIDIYGVLHHDLGERMAYNWSSIFGEQLKSGQSYDKVSPVVSI